MSIFEDKFWGDKNAGYDTLVASVTAGRESSKEFVEFLKQRAVLEDLYSKGLHKVSKFASGHGDNGTFHPLWKLLGEEVEKESNTHAEVSKKFNDLASQVSKFCSDQDKKFQTTLDSLSSTAEAVKNINKVTKDLYKSEEKYISKCFDKEQAAKLTGGKEVDKAEVLVRKSMDEYKSNIQKYSKVKENFLPKFASATTKFQEMETEHLEGMKSHLDVYVDIIEEGLSYDYQATLDFKESNASQTVEQLLLSFVQAKSTGTEKPTDIEQVVFDGDQVIKSEKESKQHLQDDEYYKDMIAKIVPPPCPDDQLMINRDNPKNVKGFLKRMKKERKKKKKQRTTSSASSEGGSSVRSPAPQTVDQVQMDYNRSVSVDDDGYSVPSAAVLSQVATSSNADNFYSSSEDESDEDPASQLKFSIKPPNVHLAPSMEDLQQTVKSLTLERSPRMNRRALNASNNDVSAASTPGAVFESRVPGVVIPADPDARADVDLDVAGERMPSPEGGEMMGIVPDDPYYGSDYQEGTADAYGSSTADYSPSSGGYALDSSYNTSNSYNDSSYYASRPAENGGTQPVNRYGSYDYTAYYRQESDNPPQAYSSDEEDAPSPPSMPPPKLPPPRLPQESPARPSAPPVPNPTQPSNTRAETVAVNENEDDAELSQFAPAASDEFAMNGGVGGRKVSMGFSGGPGVASRGPSPLSVGSSDSIPIAVAVTETINAMLSNPAQLQVQGVLSVSFPTGILQLFASNKFIDDLKFSVLNSNKLDRAVSNDQIISSSCSPGTFGSHVEYTFNMKSLEQNLRAQYAASPTASFYNVDLLKYEIDPGAYMDNYTPLQLKCGYQEGGGYGSLRVDYMYNEAAFAQTGMCKPLLNMNVLAKISNTSQLQTSPTANLNEDGKVIWKIGALSINSQPGQLNVDWSSAASAPDHVPPPAVAAQFSCEGATLSGLEFDLLSPGYRISLYKKKLTTGKYLYKCG